MLDEVGMAKVEMEGRRECVVHEVAPHTHACHALIEVDLQY